MSGESFRHEIQIALHISVIINAIGVYSFTNSIFVSSSLI